MAAGVARAVAVSGAVPLVALGLSANQGVCGNDMVATAQLNLV